MPEIRVEVPAIDIAVLDGYCSATGKSRTEIIIGLVKEWSAHKLRESILVCRVAGVNPMTADTTGTEGHCNRGGVASSGNADRVDRG